MTKCKAAIHSRGTYHAADIQVGCICPLALRNALNASLLDVEPAGESLELGVKGVAILKALIRHRAGWILIVTGDALMFFKVVLHDHAVAEDWQGHLLFLLGLNIRSRAGVGDKKKSKTAGTLKTRGWDCFH